MSSAWLKRYAIYHFTKNKGYYSKLHHEYPFINIVLKYYKPNLDMIEIGCGTGFFLNCMLHYSSSALVGVDICKSMVTEAHKRFKKIGFLNGDAENLPLKSASVRTVFVRNLLHHLVGGTRCLSKVNVTRTLEEIKRVSDNEGHIFFLEQCVLSNVLGWVLFWGSLLAARLNISLPKINLRDKVVVSFLTFNQLIHSLEQAGFNIIVGFFYHPYTGLHFGMIFGDAIIYAKRS